MMKLAKYGQREWLGGGMIALFFIVIGLLVAEKYAIAGWSIIILSALIWLALAAFFRVPVRIIPTEAGILVSPADGVVKDIEVVTDHGIEPFADQPLLRIGIFLSVLDVHVNRAPADMKVTYRHYKEGYFHDARDPRCAKENESLVIAGQATVEKETFPMAVRQISGAIARRIVCEPEQGDFLKKGEIYGMIKFGSRTELYFPADERITPDVAIGCKVRSGSTVIAKLKQTI